MAKKKDLMEQIERLTEELKKVEGGATSSLNADSDQANSDTANADTADTTAADTAKEPQDAQPKAEPKNDTPKSEPDKKNAPKPDDAKAAPTTEKAPARPVDIDPGSSASSEAEELSKMSIDELTRLSRQMEDQIGRASKKLSVAEKKLKMVNSLVTEKEAEAKAKAEAERKAKAEAAAKAKAEAGAVVAGGESSRKSESQPAFGRTGVGKAYKYWNEKTKTWGLTSDFWAAKQISEDLWEVIWVYYRNGSIDHILTDDEIGRLLP